MRKVFIGSLHIGSLGVSLEPLSGSPGFTSLPSANAGNWFGIIPWPGTATAQNSNSSAIQSHRKPDEFSMTTSARAAPKLAGFPTSSISSAERRLSVWLEAEP
jgi:hypothetical protein